MVDLVGLERMAREEYADIVLDAYRVDAKLRVLLADESYLDFWWSEVEPGRFAHHRNRQHVDGTIHRHDNSRHRQWQHVETFPQHDHREREDAVSASFLPTEPREAVRAFLTLCREVMEAGGTPS
jgi:Family of unknown function (DUF6516)